MSNGLILPPGMEPVKDDRQLSAEDKQVWEAMQTAMLLFTTMLPDHQFCIMVFENQTGNGEVKYVGNRDRAATFEAVEKWLKANKGRV
jgi:hypothetical protein